MDLYNYVEIQRRTKPRVMSVRAIKETDLQLTHLYMNH